MMAAEMLARRAGRHARRSSRRRLAGRALALAALAAALFLIAPASPAAVAAVAVPAGHAQLAGYYIPDSTIGQRLLDKAETRTGDWYAWGGAGPSVFDCSGLVYWAAGQIGLRDFPRTTYDMISSPRLERIPVSQAQRGDLMFYGSGHVEILTMWYHQTFGAQQPGTRVSWHYWSGWWQPTMAFRILW